MFISALTLFYYTFNTYTRWLERPVILEFDEVPTDVFEIPFPAVTVCPNFVYFKSKLDIHQLLSEYKKGKLNHQEIKNLETVAIVCDDWIGRELNHSPIMNNFNLRDDLFISSYSYSMYIHWYKEVSYEKGEIMTDTGVCSTFNTISAHSIFRTDVVDSAFLRFHPHEFFEPKFWDIEDGFTPKKLDTYPLRSFDKGNGFYICINFNDRSIKLFFKGEDNGYVLYFSMWKNVLNNINTVCRSNTMSLKISLHHPAEVVSTDYLIVPFNSSVKIYIKPKIIKTSDNLRSYSPTV